MALSVVGSGDTPSFLVLVTVSGVCKYSGFMSL